jgi:hypothetical protein
MIYKNLDKCQCFYISYVIVFNVAIASALRYYAKPLLHVSGRAAALFTQNGIIKTPYLQTVNIQPGSEKPEKIKKYLSTPIEMIYSESLMGNDYNNKIV